MTDAPADEPLVRRAPRAVIDVRDEGVTCLMRVLEIWETRLAEEEAEQIRCILDRAVGFCSTHSRMFPEIFPKRA